MWHKPLISLFQFMRRKPNDSSFQAAQLIMTTSGVDQVHSIKTLNSGPLHYGDSVVVQFTFYIMTLACFMVPASLYPPAHGSGYSSCFILTTGSDEHILCFDVLAELNPTQHLSASLLAHLHPLMRSCLRSHFLLLPLSCHGWLSQVLLCTEICQYLTQIFVCVFVPKVYGKITS